MNKIYLLGMVCFSLFSCTPRASQKSETSSALKPQVQLSGSLCSHSVQINQYKTLVYGEAHCGKVETEVNGRHLKMECSVIYGQTLEDKKKSEVAMVGAIGIDAAVASQKKVNIFVYEGEQKPVQPAFSYPILFEKMESSEQGFVSAANEAMQEYCQKYQIGLFLSQ